MQWFIAAMLLYTQNLVSSVFMFLSFAVRTLLLISSVRSRFGSVFSLACMPLCVLSSYSARVLVCILAAERF